MSRARVVISGLGFITSIGLDRSAVAASLRSGRNGIVSHRYFPEAEISVRVAGVVPGFSFPQPKPSSWTWPAEYDIPPESLRPLAPNGLYALCAVTQALRDAQWTDADVRSEATGLFCASAGSPWLQHEVLKEMHATRAGRISPMSVVSTISGTLNFTLATHFGIRGAVVGFVSACASSAHAIGYAVDELRLGRLDRAIVVGAEDITAESHVPFHGMRALSRNPDPATASRPFDAARDGFVATGGATALLLERAEAVAARRRAPYAGILGWGQSADGHSVAISDPNGAGLARAMHRALGDAAVAPTAVDYVNAHATSTPTGDRSEALALHTVFTATGARPAISSTKGITGHGLSLASAMETGFCALALKEGFVPGNPHLVTPDPVCEGLNLPRESLATPPRLVLKNSSAFGGSNVCLVLGACAPA